MSEDVPASSWLERFYRLWTSLISGGRLKVELGTNPTIDIGKVEQGAPNAGGADAWPVSDAAMLLRLLLLDLRVSQSRASYVLSEDGSRILREDGMGFVMAENPDGELKPWLVSLEASPETPVPSSIYVRSGYLFLNGASGASASTPDASVLDIVGDMDVRIASSEYSWVPVPLDTLISKWNTAGNQRSWALNLNTDGTLTLFWSTTGTAGSTLSISSTVPVPFSGGVIGAIRVTIDVDNGASGNTVTFYTKSTVPDRAHRDVLEDSGWMQLGAAITTAGVTSIHSGSADFVIGDLASGGAASNSRIYAAVLKSGIGSAGLVVDAVNFSDKAKWTSTTRTIVDDYSRVWTLGADAVIAGAANVIIASELVTKTTVTATASGDTTLRTPASGKKIRLYFFGYSAGAGVTGVLAGLKLAGYNSGAVFDQQYLVAAGQPYARNIMGGKKYIEGSTNGALTVNLSAAQTVYVNYEVEEVV